MNGWATVGEYVLLLASFVAGAMLSVWAHPSAMRGKRPWHALPLAVAACVLVVTALAGIPL